ncbi:MAG: response regulator transcription factor [Sandaracinaceae bacterium]
MSNWLTDVLDAVAAPDADLPQLAAEALAAFDISHVIYTMRDARGAPLESSFHTMPTWWDALCQSQPAGTRDPFLVYCCRRFEPTFSGGSLLANYPYLSARERDFIAMSSTSGFRGGVALPMEIVGQGPVGGWNVGGDFDERRIRALFAERGVEIRLALTVIHQRMARSARTANPLSPRERDCLMGLASGEQLKQIGARLGIAYSTVEFHLRNGRRKLGAITREQAVARALSERWIDLP